MNYGELMDQSDGRISEAGRSQCFSPLSVFPTRCICICSSSTEELQTLRKETKQNKLVPYYFITSSDARDFCKTRTFQPSTFPWSKSRLSYDSIFIVLHHSGHFHFVPASLIRSGDLQFYFYPLRVLCFSLGA